jgi:hypothetical protein
MTPIESAVVPAKDGFEWVRIALRLYRSQWLRYTSLAALYLLIMQVSVILTGGLFAFFLKPIFSVGFLAAAWHHERGVLPSTQHLFAGFKSNLKALLPLGVVYLLGMAAVAALAVSIQGLTLDQLMPVEGVAKITDAELLRLMLTILGLSIPIHAALWFAPALIVFSDATLFQALLTSLQAWTRNIGAILLYCITLFALIVLAVMATSPFIFALGKTYAQLVLMLLAVPLSAIIMISDYVSYRRVFHRNERLTPLDGTSQRSLP